MDSTNLGLLLFQRDSVGAIMTETYVDNRNKAFWARKAKKKVDAEIWKTKGDVIMSNLPALKQAAPMGLDYSDSKTLDTLRATVAVNATPEEFQMFIAFCQSTGLNPFKKEIWFIKTKPYKRRDGTMSEPKVQMMTGINGFYTIANSHPQYDGMEEVVIETSGNQILRATAKVWRKDRRFPSVGVAEWKEYFPGTTERGGSIWETKPRMMISKVAESIALRKAFPQELNGLYTAEEMPAEYSAPRNNTGVTVAEVLPVSGRVDTRTGEIIEDDLPEAWSPKESAEDLKLVKEMIDAEDLSAIESWVIKTKGRTHNMTVAAAVEHHKEQIKANLSKYKAADKIALGFYLEAIDGPEIPGKVDEKDEAIDAYCAEVERAAKERGVA